MGLGSAASVPLANARERAALARQQIAQGLNPIDERKQDKGIPTFGEMADEVREALSAASRRVKHKATMYTTRGRSVAAPRPTDARSTCMNAGWTSTQD